MVATFAARHDVALPLAFVLAAASSAVAVSVSVTVSVSVSVCTPHLTSHVSIAHPGSADACLHGCVCAVQWHGYK